MTATTKRMCNVSVSVLAVNNIFIIKLTEKRINVYNMHDINTFLCLFCCCTLLLHVHGFELEFAFFLPIFFFFLNKKTYFAKL